MHAKIVSYWFFDAVYGTLHAQLVNTNYSLPTTYIGLTIDGKHP